MTESEKIEKLRKRFRNDASKYCKRYFENKQYGIKFRFNKLSINKIGCLKSIKQSLKNGFTVEEHFKAASQIKELFEESQVYWQTMIKNKQDELETTYLCVKEIEPEKFAYMVVVVKGIVETQLISYINIYLSKKME